MTLSDNRKWYELGLVISLATITNILFWDGHLDSMVARLFYRPDSLDDLWPLQKFWLWQGLYAIGNLSAVLGAVLALILILLSWIKKTSYSFRLKNFYIIMVIVLGPGLVVNAVLKDHWGRPRPREVVEFSGQYQYQPPLVASNQGKHSFVCGHCSASYCLFAFYFILRKRQTLALGLSIGYGLLMGVARMSAGGHFASDVLWSGYVIFILCWFLYYFIFKEFRDTSQEANAISVRELSVG